MKNINDKEYVGRIVAVDNDKAPFNKTYYYLLSSCKFLTFNHLFLILIFIFKGLNNKNFKFQINENNGEIYAVIDSSIKYDLNLYSICVFAR